MLALPLTWPCSLIDYLHFITCLGSRRQRMMGPSLRGSSCQVRAMPITLSYGHTLLKVHSGKYGRKVIGRDDNPPLCQCCSCVRPRARVCVCVLWPLTFPEVPREALCYLDSDSESALSCNENRNRALVLNRGHGDDSPNSFLSQRENTLKERYAIDNMYSYNL